jgi:hypothetical protein
MPPFASGDVGTFGVDRSFEMREIVAGSGQGEGRPGSEGAIGVNFGGRWRQPTADYLTD